MSRLMQIPVMPGLWDMPRLLVNHKALKGALVHWAVYVSLPDDLAGAVTEFMREWPHEDFCALSSCDLRKAVRETIGKCPLVCAWNVPKLEGAVNEYGFASISSYDRLNPDYDFIDLDALAHNVAKDIVLWAQVDAAVDEARAISA